MNTANQESGQNASALLKSELAQILEIWTKLVLDEVEAARMIHASDLKNSIPIFLENLASVLAHGNNIEHFELEVAREHGKERSNLPMYTLEQIIAEYRILRRVIFKILGAKLTQEDRDLIIEAIEIGISEAASEFTKQQFRLREQFVNMLAHDLRNPLSAIKSNAQLILRAPEKTESIQVMASRIVNSINRTDNMIKDLLDSNLIQMGRIIPLEIQSTDLIALVKLCIEEAMAVHGERFTLNADSSIPGHWDPVILQRAIGNLLTNAIKYGDAQAMVDISITHDEHFVKLAVHNKGKSISKEHQKIIFDNYFGKDVSLGLPKNGWGIGLYLVKGAMDAHGGQVEVQSSDLEGTTFTLTFPKDSRSLQEKEIKLH